MRSSFVSLGIVLIISFALYYSGVVNALFAFLTIGAIPSTSYSLSPWVMFVLMTSALWVSIVLLSQEYYRVQNKHQSVNFTLPRRRYHK